MTTFVLAMFWLHVIAAVLGLFVMSVSDYPRTITKSIGSDCATLIITIVIAAWSAYLLLGK